jgi:hypothetical protein
MLKPFKIAPDKFRDGAVTRRGYSTAAFNGVFDRYLAAGQEVSAMTPAQIAPAPSIATGTSATALCHNVPQPVESGTSSGTQVEHPLHDNVVPHIEVPQEHKWNSGNHCGTASAKDCSGVPVVMVNSTVNLGTTANQEAAP